MNISKIHNRIHQYKMFRDTGCRSSSADQDALRNGRTGSVPSGSHGTVCHNTSPWTEAGLIAGCQRGKKTYVSIPMHCSEWLAWRLLDDQVHPPVFGIEDHVI